MDEREQQLYDEMFEKVTDLEIDGDEKLEILRKYHEDIGVELPKNVCMCVLDDNSGILYVKTSEADDDEYRQFMKDVNAGYTGCDRGDCSGNYIKG